MIKCYSSCILNVQTSFHLCYYHKYEAFVIFAARMTCHKLYALFFSSLFLLPVLMADGIMLVDDFEDADFSMIFNLQEEEDSEEEVEVDSDEDLIHWENSRIILTISHLEDLKLQERNLPELSSPAIKVLVPPPEHTFYV